MLRLRTAEGEDNLVVQNQRYAVDLVGAISHKTWTCCMPEADAVLGRMQGGWELVGTCSSAWNRSAAWDAMG